MKTKMTADEILQYQQATVSRIVACANATSSVVDQEGVTFYFYDDGQKFCLLTFKGKKSIKIDKHNSYKTAERRLQDFQSIASSLKRTNDYKNERKQLRAEGHSLNVGDVLYTSWGWEQTNINFYVVTRVVTKQTVELRECAAAKIESSSMSGTCTPLPEKLIGDTLRARFNSKNQGKIDGQCASLLGFKMVDGVKVWDRKSWSSYA